MKRLALALLFSCIAQALHAQTYVAPAQPRRVVPTEQRKPVAPLPPREVGGVVPRAARSGNPFQMLNPFAPARYGTAEQSVLLRPDGSGKWNGIKLFSMTF